jgi:hypothetical protein
MDQQPEQVTDDPPVVDFDRRLRAGIAVDFDRFLTREKAGAGEKPPPAFSVSAQAGARQWLQDGYVAVLLSLRHPAKRA